MSEEAKTERLSFRMTPTVSKEIDQAVEENKDIRNRSDFGEKAVEHYLDHLNGRETWESLIESVLSGLFLVAEESHSKSGHLGELRENIVKLIEGEFRE